MGTGHTYLRDAAEAVEGMARPNLVYATELRGSSKVYRSDHSAPLWSINRDGAVATSVELPAGTTSADVDKSLVIRQPILADNGSPVTVTAVNRGFFLTSSYLPEDSFLHWTGTLTLTPQHPHATLIG